MRRVQCHQPHTHKARWQQAGHPQRRRVAVHLYEANRLVRADGANDVASEAQRDLQPDPTLLWWRARIILTSFNGRFLIAAGKNPSVLNEKAAAHRVKGRSQAVAFRNSFCSALFIDIVLLDVPSCFFQHKHLSVRFQQYRTMGFFDGAKPAWP